MDFLTQVDALDKALLFADCIAALQNITPALTIEPLIQAQINAPIQSTDVPGTPQCPRFSVVQCDGFGFVFINGTETLVQATGYWNGLLGGLLDSVSTPVNGYTQAAANLVLTALAARLSGTQIRNVYFCGYSLGGAIANHAASLWARADFRNTPFSWTIGSPRTLNTRDAEFVSQHQSVRWMIDDDTVPLIPPSFAQSPSTAMLYGIRFQQRLNNFVHVAGGETIFFTGAIRSEELPANAVWSTSGALGNYLFTQDGAFGLQHSVAEYRRRFVLWRQTNPQPSRRPPTPAPQEPANPTPRQEETTQARQVRILLHQQGERQNSIPIKLPSENVFVATRSEGIWIVAFGGAVFAVGPTKRRARALARLGNEFLRRLLVQAVVQPTVIEGQLAAFLTEAADPASLIKPTLQTAFPF